MSISIGVLQSAYIWRDSKWVITNIYLKNNEKLNLLHVSPLSGPLNDWHNKCLVLLFHSFLITNVLLQALHSLNSAPSSYSPSGNGSCLGTTPWKTGRKMDLIIQLHNTYYAIYINKFYRVDRCVTVSQYVLVWVSLAQWYGYWPGVQKTLGVSPDWDLTFHHLLHKQCGFF